MLKSNINENERQIRILIGIASIAISIYYKNIFYLLGIELILTGSFGWAPIYKLIHLNRKQ